MGTSKKVVATGGYVHRPGHKPRKSTVIRHQRIIADLTEWTQVGHPPSGRTLSVAEALPYLVEKYGGCQHTIYYDYIVGHSSKNKQESHPDQIDMFGDQSAASGNKN